VQTCTSWELGNGQDNSDPPPDLGVFILNMKPTIGSASNHQRQFIDSEIISVNVTIASPNHGLKSHMDFFWLSRGDAPTGVSETL
jgi:hypothetical protein